MLGIVKKLFSLGGGMSSHKTSPDKSGDTSEQTSSSTIIEYVEDQLGRSTDFVSRQIGVGDNTLTAVYLGSTVDKTTIAKDIIPSIIRVQRLGKVTAEDLMSSSPVKTSQVKSADAALQSVLKGEVIVGHRHSCAAIAYEAPNSKYRSIEEPYVEKNIRGPHDGFIESLDVNLTLIRRKIKSSNLVIEQRTLGRTTKTRVAMVFLKDLVPRKILEETRKRLDTIDIDAVLASGYIEHMITDNPNSLFPQFLATERVDRTIASILESRIALVVEGTPVAIIFPVNFFTFTQALDDYSTRWFLGSFLRLLRYAAILVAVFLPALYIAVLTYHYEVVPYNLLLPLTQSRAEVSFSPLVEAVIMGTSFELIREATVRLPTPIAQTLGVVGGIVIGQAAVAAKLVSNIMVIVVALTGIAAFAVPSYDMNLGLTIVRFFFAILAGVWGFIGISLGLFVIFSHLVALKSLNEPYMRPLAPFHFDELKDIFIRLPLPMQNPRPGPSRRKETRVRKNIGGDEW